MSDRYLVLSVLSIDEQAELAIRLCDFFSPLNERKLRKELNLPINPKTIHPLILANFFQYWKNRGVDLFPKMQRIKELILLLKQKNVLQSSGGTDLNETFFFMKLLTEREKKGTLWLGTVLGCSYIGNEIEKDIVYIEGTTPAGDISVGTGTLIESGVILTCAHVVDDMKAEHVIIRGEKYIIKSSKSHDIADVALVYIDENVEVNSKDLVLRESAMLEPVVIAGYPTIPRSLAPCFTLQRGEISGHLQETMDKYPMDLFSAIARPGNSGGPVLSEDGCIVGIVTRSLERQQEDADSMAVFPFFASVPSNEIRKCVLELSSGAINVKWEDYA